MLILSVAVDVSKEEAVTAAHKAIAEDPENTLCARAWWLFNGWNVKCTRKTFPGLGSGAGTHIVEYDQTRYQWIEDLGRDLQHISEWRHSVPLPTAK